MNNLLTLLLLGISVGLGNFAASIAIGMSGVSRSVRTKIAIVFGLFETGMPIIGLIIGKQISNLFGSYANYIGDGLLLLAGVYELVGSFKDDDTKEVKVVVKNNFKLIMAGLALSIDNLVIGFSLGTHKEPLLLSAAVIGCTSVVLALIGLELGHQLGKKIGKLSEALSGLILISVAFALIFKLI